MHTMFLCVMIGDISFYSTEVVYMDISTGTCILCMDILYFLSDNGAVILCSSV